MNKEELIQKETLAVEEFREIIQRLNKENNRELLTIFFYHLLDTRVYIPTRDKTLILLNNKGELSLEFIKSNNFFENLYYLIEKKKSLLSIYLENIITTKVPDDFCLIGIKFEDLVDERLINIPSLKGLIIDYENEGLVLNKDNLKFLLLIKELKNK